MKRTMLCAVLFPCVPGIQTYAEPVTADKADPIGVKCEMRRECVQMASMDGKTTLAVEMRVGRYVTELNIDWVREKCARLRENCARMAPSVRYGYAECLVIEEFDARLAGDFTALEMLHEEGYNRERARSHTKGTPQHMREAMSRFKNIVLRLKYGWDSYTTVSYIMVASEKMFEAGRWFPRTVGLKKVADRYWLTEESGERNLSSILNQVSAPYFRDDATVLPQPPVDMIRLKLSLDQDSPIEKRHLSLKLETLPDDVGEDSTAVVLYIRPLFESAQVPLLQTDAELLDPPSAALKSSLEVYNDKGPTIRELVDLWAPEARENVEANLRHLENANYPLNSRFLGQHIDKVRLVARVETEDGIVWYVRYPGVKVDLKAKVGQGRVTWEDRLTTLIQRNINGEYKLAQRFEDDAVSEILTNRTIASFISRTGGSDP